MGDVKVAKSKTIIEPCVTSQLINPEVVGDSQPRMLVDRKPYVRPSFHLLDELQDRTQGTKTSAASELTTCGS